MELLRLLGSQPSGNPGQGGQGDQMQQLLQMLVASSMAEGVSRNASPEAVSTSSRAVGQEGETLRQRLAGSAQQPQDSERFAQALSRALVQLLTGGEGEPRNLVGMQVLAELLASLPRQGVEQEVVDARTGTMTFSEASAITRREGGPVDDNERQCMVCLEEFQDGENLRILPCLHRYHQRCVDRWLKENRHCPVCKHDITA